MHHNLSQISFISDASFSSSSIYNQTFKVLLISPFFERKLLGFFFLDEIVEQLDLEPFTHHMI